MVICMLMQPLSLERERHAALCLAMTRRNCIHYVGRDEVGYLLHQALHEYSTRGGKMTKAQATWRWSARGMINVLGQHRGPRQLQP